MKVSTYFGWLLLLILVMKSSQMLAGTLPSDFPYSTLLEFKYPKSSHYDSASEAYVTTWETVIINFMPLSEAPPNTLTFTWLHSTSVNLLHTGSISLDISPIIANTQIEDHSSGTLPNYSPINNPHDDLHALVVIAQALMASLQIQADEQEILDVNTYMQNAQIHQQEEAPAGLWITPQPQGLEAATLATASPNTPNIKITAMRNSHAIAGRGQPNHLSYDLQISITYSENGQQKTVVFKITLKQELPALLRIVEEKNWFKKMMTRMMMRAMTTKITTFHAGNLHSCCALFTAAQIAVLLHKLQRKTITLLSSLHSFRKPTIQAL